MQRRDRRCHEPDTRRAEPRADREDDERGDDRDHDLGDAHGEPRAAERPVHRREEPAVERLRIRRRHAGEEPERPVLDESRREPVALVDECLEDRLALAREDERTRHRGDDDDDGGCRRTLHLGSTSMGATSRERYAVVSCHVERPLDDASWARFAALQESRPGGFAIAALLRPANAAFGEDLDAWLERARDAAGRGPLGHHTHWTAPDHARPTGDGTGVTVRDEAAGLRAVGIAPTIFCGGGWYTDGDVADACSELGYVDCTPRATRPPYLEPGTRWATLSSPATIDLPSGRVLRAIPTTHSLGDLARALPRRELPSVVHVYFHDTDLLDRRRRLLFGAVLRALSRRAQATDLDALAAAVLAD